LSLLVIVVPFPVVSRWWDGERTIDLAQTLIVYGTSFVRGGDVIVAAAIGTTDAISGSMTGSHW
jgi:hypothetical protein